MRIKNDMQFGFRSSISPRKQCENYTAKRMPGKLQQARGRSGTSLGEAFWTQGSGGTLSATRTHVRGPSASHWEEAVTHIFPLSNDILEIFGQCPGGKMKSR